MERMGKIEGREAEAMVESSRTRSELTSNLGKIDLLHSRRLRFLTPEVELRVSTLATIFDPGTGAFKSRCHDLHNL